MRHQIQQCRTGVRKGLFTRRFDLRDDAGFSLISATVALGIATVSILGLGHTMASALQSTTHAKRVQQATALATKAIEATRDLSYAGLLLCTTDVTGDPAIVGGKFDTDGAGPLLAEPIAHIPTGCGVDRNPPPVFVAKESFSVQQYVTWVDADEQGGIGQDYKRLTVLVEWNQGSNVQRFSTIVTRNQRGLPTPKYLLTPKAQELSAEPGHQVVFAHAIQNLGSIDAYDLAVPVPMGRTWTIGLYKDVNRNEEYDPDLDLALTDTNATGVVDTGNVGTNETTYFLAVWTLSNTEAGGKVELNMTATSGIDSDVTATAADTLQIGYPGITFYLKSKPTPPTADVIAQSNQSLSASPPTATTLYKYSTNLYTIRPGRLTDKKEVNLATESNTQYMSNWIYQFPTQTKFQGTAEMKLWVAMKDFACDKTPTITIYLRQKSSGTSNAGTVLASKTVTSPPPGGTECGFREITTTFTIDHTIAKDKWLELKTVVDNSSGDGVLTAYDTTSYPSRIKLPAVST